MKKRFLRKEIQYALTGITAVLLMLVMMINDFELKAIPFIAGAIALSGLNVYVLTRWGRIYE